MNKYKVHFSGYYGYDITVNAEDENQAIHRATNAFDDEDANNFWFENENIDVIEC